MMIVGRLAFAHVWIAPESPTMFIAPSTNGIVSLMRIQGHIWPIYRQRSQSLTPDLVLAIVAVLARNKPTIEVVKYNIRPLSSPRTYKLKPIVKTLVVHDNLEIRASPFLVSQYEFAHDPSRSH
jgi:hypothetical protein